MSAARAVSANAHARPWWKGAAIYQIYPLSFADSNGDGYGDLPGITAHLDHIASLGVDGIWISPFFPSPMKDFGYDVSDYCSVDPIFGTLQDFDRLVERAHALGLKVIIDQVLSHTSDQHAWFRESRADRTNPKADWYVWADAKPDGTPPCNWQSVFGGPAWEWDARRGQYYLHNFLREQPDLNVHNPEVQDALLASSRFWLERGVDGFRFDAINFAMHDPLLRDNPPAPDTGKPRSRPFDFQQSIYNKSHTDIPRFIRRLRALIESYPDRFTVAEVGGPNAEDEMHRFTSGSQHFHSAYGFNFLNSNRLSPQLIQQALTAWPDEAHIGWPSWAFSNHDAPRVTSRWAPPERREAMAKLSMLLLACLRGNIFIYQGEELALPQAHIPFDQLKDPEAIANWPLTLGRDGARTLVPWTANAQDYARGWLPMPGEHLDLAVEHQRNSADSMLAFTRRVLELRSHTNALLVGAMTIIHTDDSILAFERATRDERILCVFNVGSESKRWPVDRPEQWAILETTGHSHPWELAPLSGVVARRIGS